MTKKFRTLMMAVAMLVTSASMARADEGMWLLSLIGKNYADMQKAGFKLTPEDIYSVNQSCLKDAIVGLGNLGSPFWHFCTGEIISNQGLLSTNHHCGYGKLQEHSTVQHDYLRDGFWAYSKKEELPNPGLTASILVRMEDVTEQVLSAVSDDMSETERAAAVREVSSRLVRQATEGTPYDATVRAMFNGNQYFLFVHIIYKDVRLVGAPPSSMGKFGGDTDNWSWPRHTCDFSLFRIYTAPDGMPAEYSDANIPLTPKHYLPVSNKEIKNGDFAMVMGFPGTTNHFLTSYGLAETMDITNKLRYEIRTVKINILREEMAASQETKIKYASKYASCSNYWKYSNEQNKALKNLNVMGDKKDLEHTYNVWAVGKDPKYMRALPLIKKGYADRAPYLSALMYLSEGLTAGCELPWQTLAEASILDSASRVKDPDTKEAMIADVRAAMKDFYKDYSPATEQRLMAAMFAYVYTHMEMSYMPQFLVDADKKYKGDFEKYVAELFEKSPFVSEQKFDEYLKKGNFKNVSKDPIFLIGQQIRQKRIEVSSMISRDASEGMQRGIRDFTDGLLRMREGGRLMSPDANSTIRLTYGNVKAYAPRDAVAYDYYTTLRGVIEKEDPTNSEFIVPERLKNLYYSQDFGPYANSNGELPTCFITTNDITGGNSGSPVIDAEGNLIGLAFDGNSEAMSGDIQFEKNLQHCICLDSRYMLFVIDKYAGAKNLIDEMTIVR